MGKLAAEVKEIDFVALIKNYWHGTVSCRPAKACRSSATLGGMKIAGFLLMPAGWLIVLAALVLLPTFPAKSAFVAAGSGVEVLGLILFARTHGGAKRGIQ